MTLQDVALDAMGVIYPVADDLRDLLIPYLRTRGCELPDGELIELYRACYRHGMPARELWQQTGCDWTDGALETGFLSLYELRPGVLEFLQAMRSEGIPVYGLSNDVAEWAIARRKTFGIEEYFAGWVVSGDVKLYKPDPAIYDLLLAMLPGPADECLFVDDSQTNVEAARTAGLQAVRFAPGADIESFAALQALVLARRP